MEAEMAELKAAETPRPWPARPAHAWTRTVAAGVHVAAVSLAANGLLLYCGGCWGIALPAPPDGGAVEGRLGLRAGFRVNRSGG